MTKREVLEFLEPFDDDVELFMVDGIPVTRMEEAYDSHNDEIFIYVSDGEEED